MRNGAVDTFMAKHCGMSLLAGALIIGAEVATVRWWGWPAVTAIWGRMVGYHYDNLHPYGVFDPAAFMGGVPRLLLYYVGAIMWLGLGLRSLLIAGLSVAGWIEPDEDQGSSEVTEWDAYLQRRGLR